MTVAQRHLAYNFVRQQSRPSGSWKTTFTLCHSNASCMLVEYDTQTLGSRSVGTLSADLNVSK